MRRYSMQLVCFVVLALVVSGAQDRENKTTPQPGAEYSGMYNFLREGEFVQLTVEDQGHVTGFVSRYGDSESDRGAFLDHFFKQGKLDGNRLGFTTEIVHGVWFEFRGTVERGEGKSRGDEAYYVLKGALVENTSDEAKKTSSHSREVALKSFPQDMAPPQAERSRPVETSIKRSVYEEQSVAGGPYAGLRSAGCRTEEGKRAHQPSRDGDQGNPRHAGRDSEGCAG